MPEDWKMAYYSYPICHIIMILSSFFSLVTTLETLETFRMCGKGGGQTFFTSLFLQQNDEKYYFDKSSLKGMNVRLNDKT